MSVEQVRAAGIEETLARIPASGQYYVTMDIDGIAPGTGTPSPDGFLYPEGRKLLKELTEKGNVIGFDMVETAQQNDHSDITVQLAAFNMRDFMM